MAKPLIIFDLDGTLYRGDAPYWYYAEQVSRFLPPEIGQAYLQRVENHLTGRQTVEASDNWEAVVRLMEPFGESLTPEQWQEAFMATRRYMLSGQCPLELPWDLKPFLSNLKGQVILAVASNSPDEAAKPLLEQLGLIGLFDVIKTAAQKPEGLITLVSEITHNDYAPDQIFSIGDHYNNDIAPGIQHGWITGHISPRRIFPGPATFKVTALEELYPHIRTWVQRIKEGTNG
ncbi:HAD family hydrolase [Sulfobacillus thermosulfidooxidans]|uniref:HAD family hydrolase n=1 Tax=Sulfobacillus thermosulfidooxidans TaxID=28034 RepID=UPI001494402D|nr:HAD family hydrolase [Sulfobacillus thermosulfidooxidans]